LASGAGFALMGLFAATLQQLPRVASDLRRHAADLGTVQVHPWRAFHKRPQIPGMEGVDLERLADGLRLYFRKQGREVVADIDLLGRLPYC